MKRKQYACIEDYHGDLQTICEALSEDDSLFFFLFHSLDEIEIGDCKKTKNIGEKNFSFFNTIFGNEIRFEYRDKENNRLIIKFSYNDNTNDCVICSIELEDNNEETLFKKISSEYTLNQWYYTKTLEWWIPIKKYKNKIRKLQFWKRGN